jgi:hypothetical protein
MPPRLTITEVKECIESSGCKLISETYTSNKKPIQVQCSCEANTIYETKLQDFKHGTRCSACRLDRMKATNKERFGYEFVSQRPDKKESALSGILKYIAEKKHTLEELKDYYKEQGCELLESSYKDSFTKMRFKCICGREGITNYNKFRIGQRCSHPTCMDTRKKETNLKQFGSISYTGTPEYKARYKETCLELYGVEHSSQSPIVQERIERSGLKFKTYTFPSGRTVPVQGFEHYALDYLLKTYSEEDLKVGRLEQPEIWYFDDDCKPHRYFSDIYIPKTKTIVEVKSTWTYEKGLEKLALLINTNTFC